MSSQASIKRIRALHRKKERKQTGLALAQGRKLVAELVESDMSLVEVHVLAREAQLLEGLDDGVGHIATGLDLERMATLQTGVSAVAVFEQPDYGQLLPEEGEVYFACDAVGDPGNFGTIVRSADCFGITGVICGLDTVDPFNPKSVQAAMGSLFRVPVFSMDLNQLNESDLAIYMADMEGTSLYEIQIKTPAVIVLGNESHGVTESFPSGSAFTIPITGSADSLNVSMAATVIASELHRREI